MKKTASEVEEYAGGVFVNLLSADSGSTGNAALSGSSQSGAVSEDNSQTNSYSEAFSNRDLSGEYDASDAVTISLGGSSASASSETVQISGSTVTITAAGTYVLSGTLENGSIIVNGGTINVTGQSSFDCDGSAQYNGGTIIVNGQQVNSIPNQMMGGMGGMGSGMGGFGGGRR